MPNVLMPQATAVWLLENTSLTFEQIGAFCGLHHLEVSAIANEDVAKGIRGVDPIAGGFLVREEIEKGERDGRYRLKPLEQTRVDLPQTKARKGARYTPIARRGDKPDAVAWLLRHHPEVPDSQIMKLIGTTKSTIQKVRERSHWNSANIKPVDPVSLGLCTQIELDAAVQRAAASRPPQAAPADGPSLRPAAQTVAPAVYEQDDDEDDSIDDEDSED